MVEARSYDDLAKAGDDLASAARTVGAGQWPGFVRDADRRAAEAVSSGDIPGVVKASVLTEGASAGLSIVLGMAAILWGRSRSSTPRPTRAVPAAPLPSSPTVMQHDGPEDADPATGKAAPANGSKQPQPPAAEPVEAKNGRLDLPANPDDLLKEGWVETTHPEAAKNGHRKFKNPQTGEEVQFDKGELSRPGYRSEDHYHRFNNNKTGKKNYYLDEYGNTAPDGSKKSHIKPGR